MTARTSFIAFAIALVLPAAAGRAEFSAFAALEADLSAVASAEADAPSLAAARELYAAAEYADALMMLDALILRETSREELRTMELYRTLCLVAIGRTAEADRAIEAMIAQDPLYRPSLDDIPPRMRSAFSETRKRLLPSIIQQRYTEAKSAFDREDFKGAASGFKQVLDAFADPDMSSAASQPPLSDLRTLAGGFHDLSAKMAAPPPLPAEPAPAVAPIVPEPPKYYSASNTNVTPPVVIRQRVPPYPGKVLADAMGIMEVIIDETGAVESATMRVPLNPQYDKHALAAAKNWQYHPARLDGVPVKYRKMVQVSLLKTSTPGFPRPE